MDDIQCILTKIEYIDGKWTTFIFKNLITNEEETTTGKMGYFWEVVDKTGLNINHIDQYEIVCALIRFQVIIILDDGYPEGIITESIEYENLKQWILNNEN